jgi:hypothetical protein
LALRLLFDYLAIHRRSAQSATQIAAGMCSQFYEEHGSNSGTPSKRRISRSAVKEYVKRIRKALGIAMQEEGFACRHPELLISHRTVGNEVLYSLHAAVGWIHQEDLPSRYRTAP